MSQIFDTTTGRWRPLTTTDLATGGCGGGGGGGTVGGALETTQTSVLTAVQNIDAGLGAKGDAAASSDSGTFSLIALIKRALANWTTLLARVPTLGRTTAAGSIPVTLPTDVPTDLVADSAGVLFSPGSCAVVRTYDGSGNLLTESAAVGGVTRVKTYTWTSGNLTNETKWVAQ